TIKFINMASAFITPSKRVSYYNSKYGRGEICFKKRHSILVRFDNPHEELEFNPLQGNKGKFKRYKWFPATDTKSLLNSIIPSKSEEVVQKTIEKKVRTKSTKSDNSDKIKSAIVFLKKEGYKVFKLTEV